MVTLGRAALAAVALASAVTAQTTSRTFHVTNVPTQAAMNELATIIRTLNAGSPFSDLAKQEITVSGTADELALAAWFVQHLDLQTPPLAPAQYTVSGSDSVRIYYLAHMPQMSEMNEFVTVIRTVGDIQRIFTYSPLRAITIRTTPDKTQMTDWLVHQMDVTADNHAHVARYDFPIKGCPDGVVEVAFLTHPASQATLVQTVTTLRAIADVQAIFTHTLAPQGIAFRGCGASQLQLADWLVQQLDTQPDAQARAQKHEFDIPGSTDPVARVYYLNSNEQAANNQLATVIRSESQVRKIFVTQGTLALRGTPDEVAVADRIIQERDR